MAGLAIESSTFSPAVTHEEAFHSLYGTDVLNYYPFLQEGSENLKKALWFPTLKAKAIPGGIVSRKAYESLVKQTIDMLKENLPYDAMYLELHGAMSVEGLDDPEADYVKNIKSKIEPSTEYTLRTDFEILLNAQKPRTSIEIEVTKKY